MSDPTPPTPPETASGPKPASQSNPIARSALGIMRRTERALSPWSRRALQVQSSPVGAVQRSSEAGAPRSPVVAARNLAVSSRATLTLARRVQTSETPTVIQRTPEPRTALSLDRFAATLVRRFPEVAAKYEPKTTEAPEAIQRAPLPFVGSETAASEPASGSIPMPSMPMPSDEGEAFYPSISAQESVASQLAERLQTFRDVASPSPREISRKTAERAASRSNSGPSNQPVIRRSRVEEIGQKSAALPTPTEEPPAAPRQTIQRKPADAAQTEPPAPEIEAAPKPTADQPKREPAATPRPRAATTPPTVQRKPAPPFQSEPASEAEANLGPRPELPSLSQQLLQRFEAGREAWNENPEPDSDLPSFLRPASAPAPEATEPSTVQRKAEAPNAEVPATEQPPGIEERDSRPARRQTQSKLSPVVQRKPEAEPAEPAADLPLVQKPAVTPPVKTTQPPAIQRSPEETENPVESAAPAVEPPGQPIAATPERAPADLPLAVPPATVQRKPAVETAAEAPAHVEYPAPAATTEPTIQRTPETAPAPADDQPPIAMQADLEPSLPDVDNLQPTPPAAPPAPQPPTVQRLPEPLPLRQPPQSASQPVQTAELPAAPSDVPPSEPPAASPSLPRSAPPSIQRALESHASLPDLPLPETSFEAPQQLPAPPAVSVQRKLTPEASQASMPLAAPRGEIPTPASGATGIQRTPTDEAIEPEAMPLVAIREPQPASKAPPKPMAIVQRKPAQAETATLDTPFPTLPLARVSQTVSNKVQREVTETTSNDAPTLSTSTSGDPSNNGSGGGKGSTADLHDLARRIYPILKRMLAIEKERR